MREIITFASPTFFGTHSGLIFYGFQGFFKPYKPLLDIVSFVKNMTYPYMVLHPVLAREQRSRSKTDLEDPGSFLDIRRH